MSIWIARDKDDYLWIFEGKPHKDETNGRWRCFERGRTLAVCVSPDFCEFDGDLDNVKWGDKEPTELIVKK